ncbi:hypothetical protein V1517DRAFT_333337 [Lipomyces orientalis]|uniref:Uncharacterized protein n=1 Tax=Lipomyces orientalis TaxID=1233043 RepID=A0ACC3TEJ1_9ASCO
MRASLICAFWGWLVGANRITALLLFSVLFLTLIGIQLWQRENATTPPNHRRAINRGRRYLLDVHRCHYDGVYLLFAYMATSKQEC